MTDTLYRTIWRWHFYAGLFVMPFIFVLALTGAVFLFKPQLDRWQESPYHGHPAAGQVSPSQQLEAALAAFPTASFQSYRLPALAGDAPAIRLGLPNGSSRDVFVSPQGTVLGSLDPDTTISATVKRIHGELLVGKVGSWLVETVGCWAIVMVLSGLYLWLPRNGGLAGVVWPRINRGNQAFWRDLHAVTGFWVAGLAMILLITALPWAGVWGSAFKTTRAEMGWTQGRPDWKIGAESGGHGGHGGHAGHAGIAMNMAGYPDLNAMVRKAATMTLAPPILVAPPKDSGGNASTAWTIKNDTQNRPLVVVMTFDPATGRQISWSGQAGKHPIDQAVAYGIAWHEGQLFGWVNQLIGLLTALMLIGLVVSSFVLWRRRKPKGVLGAPPVPAMPARVGGVVVIVLVLALLLPMLAISLVAVWLVERLILSRNVATSRWLGLSKA